MTLSVIAAMAENRVIGVENRLPWHLPNDLKFFKRVTTGKPIIMGRKTFESIGRALPGRRNIVVSRDADYKAEGCEVVTSLDEAVEKTSDCSETMVIGGASLYEQAVSIADKIYLTLVHTDSIDGDARFPQLDPDEWMEASRESHQTDDRHAFSYSFVTLEKK